jgi:hypothetical protein
VESLAPFCRRAYSTVCLTIHHVPLTLCIVTYTQTNVYHSQFFVITFEVTFETDAMERPADQRTYGPEFQNRQSEDKNK